MFLNPESLFCSIFDTVLVLVLTYSCFSSAYFLAFGFHFKKNDTGYVVMMEHGVFIFFIVDIGLNFIREFQGIDGQYIRNHL